MFTKRKLGCDEKRLPQTIFPVPPKKEVPKNVRLVFKPADTGYWILEYPVSGIRSLKITKKAKIKPDSGYSSIRKVIFPGICD